MIVTGKFLSCRFYNVKRLILTSCENVGNLSSPGAYMTCSFYVKCLGMTLLRKRDCPDEKYTNAFLGYGAEDSHCVIELTLSEFLSSPQKMLRQYTIST
jgi:lactoylglutathione lyase